MERERETGLGWIHREGKKGEGKGGGEKFDGRDDDEKEEVLLLTTTLFSIFNDGNAFAVLIGACEWENSVSFLVAWGCKSRARAQHLFGFFFIQRGGKKRERETALAKKFRREKWKKRARTLADKPCVEHTLFEKFNRVGVDVANDMISGCSYYGLKWRFTKRMWQNL